MLSNLFYRYGRLTALTLGLIIVAGIVAFVTLPRQEDPRLVGRYGTVVTLFPGASPERVEALVTKKIEDELLELDEIEDVTSYSQAGVSVINIALFESLSIEEVANAWGLIRQRVDGVEGKLPEGSQPPEVTETYLAASTMLVALSWSPGADQASAETGLRLLSRLAEDLEERLRALPGTEETDLHGQLEEEIRVVIDPAAVAGTGLTTQAIAAALRGADAKNPAGQVRSDGSDLVIEVAGALDTLDRIRQVPLLLPSPSGGADARGGETDERFLRLGDIATVERAERFPPPTLTLINGRRALVVDAKLQDRQRVDWWAKLAREEVDAFRASVPDSVQVDIILDQSRFTEERLAGLFGNLMLAIALITAVLFLTMGLRSAFVVALALPLTIGCVLAAMNGLKIPLHQMSITGLIISLGLLIDNAIVVVDDFNKARRAGEKAASAISKTIRHLFVPLLASTLTTVLAFMPIALSPGSTGEFIGTMGTVVILSLVFSFLLAMTITPTLAAFLRTAGRGGSEDTAPQRPHRWWLDGLSVPALGAGYRRALSFLLPRPLLASLVGLALPVSGFAMATTLESQFFPPVDRSQFQVQMILPPQASIFETKETVRRAHEQLTARDEIIGSAWFIGETAPRAYYNAFTDSDGQTNFAAGFITTKSAEATQSVLLDVQRDMRVAFPEAIFLTLPFEQGPPFPAPIEVVVTGPELQVLREIGDDIRRVLYETPGVTYAQAQILGGTPKVVFQINEYWAEGAGFSLGGLASALQGTLEGVEGGSVLEGSEELVIRVVSTSTLRGNLSEIATTPFRPGTAAPGSELGIPLRALGEPNLVPEIASINRENGERINPIYGFLEPYTLPAEILEDFRSRLAAAEIDLPPGYRISFGGEAEERGSAVAGLIGIALPLLVLMVGTIVLAFNSFAYAGLIGIVGILSVGLAMFGVWLFGHPLGFMAIVGTLGLIGLAINGSIVVLSALRADEEAREGDAEAGVDTVMGASRHIVSTSLTTVGGFTPLILFGDSFWPPLATAIAGGVAGSAVLALITIPALFLSMGRRRQRRLAQASA